MTVIHEFNPHKSRDASAQYLANLNEDLPVTA